MHSTISKTSNTKKSSTLSITLCSLNTSRFVYFLMHAIMIFVQKREKNATFISRYLRYVFLVCFVVFLVCIRHLFWKLRFGLVCPGRVNYVCTFKTLQGYLVCTALLCIVMDVYCVGDTACHNCVTNTVADLWAQVNSCEICVSITRYYATVSMESMVSGGNDLRGKNVKKEFAQNVLTW